MENNMPDRSPQKPSGKKPGKSLKEKREAKAKAEEQKALGTASYKKRDFEAAIEHYSKAWDLHKDITYLTNLGAAYFEKGDYQTCIETCKKAVAEGREMHADFKLISK